MAVGELLDGIEKEAEEAVKLYAELVDEAVKGAFPGTRNTHGDMEFLAWFYQMLNDYGPDWAVALEFVEGGRDVLKRANRIFAGLLGAGSDDVTGVDTRFDAVVGGPEMSVVDVSGESEGY